MPLPHAPRHTRPRPWAAMSDLEWAYLIPYVEPRSPRGRQLRDLRDRMDAIFFVANNTKPWADLPPRFGKPDTVSRYFRRLTHAGLWQRLLVALVEAAPNHPLRAIEYFIIRACRRAGRLLGLRFITLIRRIGLTGALAGPPWQMPDPILSESIHKLRLPVWPRRDSQQRAYLAGVTALKRLFQKAKGLARLPRFLQLAWS